jgi:hypothetical protein
MTPLTALLLIVDDIEAAGEDLIGRVVDVSEIFHTVLGQGVVPGIDPERRSHASRVVFSDPDGNQWHDRSPRRRRRSLGWHARAARTPRSGRGSSSARARSSGT